MRDIGNLQLKRSISRALKHNANFAQEPVSTRSATKRVVEILDAKYEKADIPAIVRENCSHLSATDREKLLSLLLKYEELFDGTLGDWNLPPVSFEIKEGMKPYHGRPYPIPQIHKAVLMKEIDRLCSIGVLKWQPNSEWASPTFIIPKKDGTVRTISDFRELNKRIIRKPYPIPKISTTLQELEGFTYATALDLNMGYYTIRLDPKSSEICTIIFPCQGLQPKSSRQFFFFSKKSGGKALLQNLENLGGDMARPRIKNLASPISDFAPPQRQSDSPPKSSRPWEDIQPLA